MQTLTATYSPEDNKLRLYALSRLDGATYTKVKEAGFKWAPRQELFVAPMWTPARESLLLELCGDVGDEDTSLVERAEERADRFGDYHDKRANDAANARQGVAALADGIPFGQPILVGHHSEARARKDAARIENGMRRAVQMWDTAEYWKRRAAGALSNAKYKELPAVRHRRIKGLEADKRKQERSKNEAAMWLQRWLECEAIEDAELRHAFALRIANVCWLHLPKKDGDREDFEQCPTAYDALNNAHSSLYAPRTLAEVVDAAKASYPRTIEHCARWIAHYENRISYERAMLDEQGGLKAEGFDVQVGGRVLIDGEWLVVMRVNKTDGRVNSVTTNAKYVRVRGVEEIKDYRAPTEEDAEKVKKATKLPPLVNFPGEGFIEMTAEAYKKKPTDCKCTRVEKATAEHGAYRYRTAFLANSGYRIVQVFITDSKRVDAPAVEAAPVSGTQAADLVIFETQREIIAEPAAKTPEPVAQVSDVDAQQIQELREQLRAGVQVVSAPQLFPTPAPLAARMVALASIRPGDKVLEPSAGTARILMAIRAVVNGSTIRTAVEISGALCSSLRRLDPGAHVFNTDFMTYATTEQFDCAIMNPPFSNGQDIDHIKRALSMLKPGGRLVAICAIGPRQNAQLRPLVDACGGTWEVLPPNTFAASGTSVNAALLTLTA